MIEASYWASTLMSLSGDADEYLTSLPQRIETQISAAFSGDAPDMRLFAEARTHLNHLLSIRPYFVDTETPLQETPQRNQ
jgi:hypothetical protein